MLITINQERSVAVTLGFDDPVWGPSPCCNCHTGFKNTRFVPSSHFPRTEKRLLVVLKGVMGLCGEVRGEKGQIREGESVRVIPNSNRGLF